MAHGSRLYPAATVFGEPGTRHPIHTILALSSWPNNVFRHQRTESICKCRFVSRHHNISGFEDCWGIAAKFELEDLFQLVVPRQRQRPPPTTPSRDRHADHTMGHCRGPERDRYQGSATSPADSLRRRCDVRACPR